MQTPSVPKDPSRRRRAAWFFAAVLLLAAVWTGTAGREWSECYHPDELAIQRWMALVRDEGYLTNRAYPNGWFQLYRIRMALQARAAKAANAWRAHVRQDGKVVTVDPATFFAPGGFRDTRPHPTIQDGRDFNSWLFVLTALFLYAACLEAGFHPPAAFVSGLFFLASPASAEFVRYCETDAALLVSMAFFAWTAARALRKGGTGRILLAAFAAGFAVACKFTLFPLLLWAFAGPAALFRRGGSRPRGWVFFAALVLAALLAAAAGYAAGTPALFHDPAWYFAALRSASRRTYAELTHHLGGVYSWRGATVLRCRSLAAVFARMGALPLLWGLFSWSFWFRRPFRRQLAGIPWLLPLFVPFLVCCCPFVRTQEALPFDLLFAMGAGLPLQWLVFSRSRRPPLRRAGKLAVPAAALLAAAA
ncbi:MAG: glycosyltransferase family 39 protein, partial [Kiritimatiellae bacterium]|nr:glycosyltransferase family 39 protein [Kiritimatiellia bacterium]